MQTKTSCAAKVAIVGAGFVGSTTAYALMMNGVASHIALIDQNKAKAEGEALDLAHCMQFTHSAELTAGDSFELVQDAEVVIITAGAAQRPGGQTRTELLQTNVSVFKEIIPKVVQYNKTCIILVVTNPVDVLTFVTQKLSGFPACRVLGAGTVLDTARLRYQLGKHFNVSPKDITAYVLGEHGDSEFVWWSGANISGVSLDHFPNYSPELMSQVFEQTKNAAYDIINKKGATYYAIALAVSKIIRAILLDQSRVFSVSTLQKDGVCLSLPTIIRRSGSCEQLEIVLSKEEQDLYEISRRFIGENIDQAMRML